MRTPVGAVAAIALIAACAGARFQLPMTGTELASQHTEPALVAFLGQADASPGVCDPAESPPLLDAPGIPAALVGGLRKGTIAPPTWRACAELVLSVPGPSRDELAGRVLRTDVDLLTSGSTELSPAEQAQVAAMREAYAARAPEVHPAAAERERAERKVGEALSRAGVPAARRTAIEALATVLEAERGAWHGRAVDAELLDGLADAREEASLEILSRRLPDASPRTEAARRVIRLRVARSPFPEVRRAAASVEERVLRLGVNPVPIVEHPLQEARLDRAAIGDRTVWVDQRWGEPDVRLLGRAGAGAPSVMSELPLRGVLDADLAGISWPVTLCAPADALDPTPCIAPGDVQVDTALARVDGRGMLRLADRAPAAETTGRAGDAVVSVSLRIGGAPAGSMAWALRFSPPGDLIVSGASPGGDGPPLLVSASRAAGGRLSLAVEGADRTFRAVIESADARTTHVVSRGADGAAGSDGVPGSDGAPGSDGMSGSCPPGARAGESGGSGGAGGDGGLGGPGGPGGRGGDVEVVFTAASEQRAETLELLRAMVASEGGAGGSGGPGGRGGRGGAGGRGGWGATCSDDEGGISSVPAGSDGSSGLDGRDGPDGAPGPAGGAGTVRVHPSGEPSGSSGTSPSERAAAPSRSSSAPSICRFPSCE